MVLQCILIHMTNYHGVVKVLRGNFHYLEVSLICKEIEKPTLQTSLPLFYFMYHKRRGYWTRIRKSFIKKQCFYRLHIKV